MPIEPRKRGRQLSSNPGIIHLADLTGRFIGLKPIETTQQRRRRL